MCTWRCRCRVLVGGDLDRDATHGPGRLSRACPRAIPVRSLARSRLIGGLVRRDQRRKARGERRHRDLLA